MEARDPDDLRRIEAEEEAAAAEAGAIGGPAPDEDVDPEMRAVYEGGGGEAEGFEMAEQELIENASHGEYQADPLADRFPPEVEADESTAEYSEPDQEDVSEVIEDPDLGPRDPGAGPGITHER
jgi:hypothetical protein